MLCQDHNAVSNRDLHYFITECSIIILKKCQHSKLEMGPSNDKYRRVYEGCSNINASGFITFFTYMLRQNGKRFYKGLYVTFKVAPDQKKNTVHLSSYSPLNEGHVCILTNSMLRTYTSDRDERIILRRTGEIS